MFFFQAIERLGEKLLDLARRVNINYVPFLLCTSTLFDPAYLSISSNREDGVALYSVVGWVGLASDRFSVNFFLKKKTLA